jgi:ribosomal 50S subunit-associated protein YjgA (DUF615 family)
VRAAAGEALLDLAVDGADSVVEAAASAVAQTELSRALMELPYLLAEIAHRRSAEVVGRLLAHADPAVVASAIDAAVLLADVALVPALQKLAKDRRVVTLSDDDGEQSAPIAELASDALGEISPGAKDRARKR